MSDIVLPLDFRLHDTNEEPVLHLDGARRLTLAIRNT
jgi:hypothetical protein